MATLAISINLDQVRQAKSFFQDLMTDFVSAAEQALKGIQAHFDKPLKLGNWEKSFQAFEVLMNKFLATAETAMGLIRIEFQTRPSLENYRKAAEEFKAITTGMIRVGKQMAAQIREDIMGMKNDFTPAIDTDKVDTARQRFRNIMQRFPDTIERVVNRMIREWNRYMKHMRDSNAELGQIVRDMRVHLDILAPVTLMLNQAAVAMTNLAKASQAVSTTLPNATKRMQFQSVGNVGAGAQVAMAPNTFNTKNFAQQQKRDLDEASASASRYRDTLLGLFFLIDKFNVFTLGQKLVQLGQQLNETQLTMDSTMATLRVAFGSERQALIEFERVAILAEQIGVTQMKAAQMWAAASAASKGTPMAGEIGYGLFSGIAKMGAVYGKDPVLAFKAIVDMLSKGQITMEDLKQQLNEQLPGSLSIFRRAATENLTTLDQVIKNTGSGFGKMGAVARSVGRIMDEEFGPEARKNVERLAGAQALLRNAWDKTLDSMNKGGFNEAWIQALKTITDFLKEPETQVAARAFGKALGVLIPEAIRNYLIPALKYLRQNFEHVITVVLTLTGALTGLMKFGLLGLALGPFTGGMSVLPFMLGGAAAGGAAGYGLAKGPEAVLGTEKAPTMLGDLWNLVKEMVTTIINIFQWIYDTLKYPADILEQQLDRFHARFGTGKGGDGGIGWGEWLERQWDKVVPRTPEQYARANPPPLSGTPTGGGKDILPGLADVYRKSLPEAMEEVEKDRLTAEWARKNQIPHAPAGPETQTKSKETEAAEKRFAVMERTLVAQLEEDKAVLALQKSTKQLSDDYAVAAMEQDLFRKAKAADVDVTGKLDAATQKLIGPETTMRDLIGTVAENKVAAAKEGRILLALEQQELKTKEAQVLEEALYNEGLKFSVGEMEQYMEFMKRKLAIEQKEGALTPERVEKLKQLVADEVSYNKAIQTRNQLLEDNRRLLLLGEQAELAWSMAVGKTPDVGKTPFIVGGEPVAPGVTSLPMDIAKPAKQMLFAEAEAIRKGREAYLLQNEGVLKMFNALPSGEQESFFTAVDKQSLERLRAETKLSVSQQLRQMDEEIAKQQDLQDVLKLGDKEREIEIARREALRVATDNNTRAITDEQKKEVEARSLRMTLLKQQNQADYIGKTLPTELRALQDLGITVFRELGRALGDFVKTGKFNFQELIQTITDRLIQLATDKAIIEPLENVFRLLMTDMSQPGAKEKAKNQVQGSNWFGNLLGGIFPALSGLRTGPAPIYNYAPGSPLTPAGMPVASAYTGGIVGSDILPRDVFAIARRYAAGGIAGVDTVPTWLHRGEGIFTAAQMRHLAPREWVNDSDDKEQPVVVNNSFNFTNSNEQSFRRSSAQVEARMSNSARRAAARLRG